MHVFHGSDVKVDKIDLSKSEFFKDFGRGFYVTNIREHAYLRAIDIARRHNLNKLIVIDEKSGNILELMLEKMEIPEPAAIKLFYSSKLYEELSNPDTQLWQKNWQELYELLINSL